MMYKKSLTVAFYVFIAAAGTLVAAISLAAPTHARLVECVGEKDTSSCPGGGGGISSANECDT